MVLLRTSTKKMSERKWALTTSPLLQKSTLTKDIEVLPIPEKVTSALMWEKLSSYHWDSIYQILQTMEINHETSKVVCVLQLAGGLLPQGSIFKSQPTLSTSMITTSLLLYVHDIGVWFCDYRSLHWMGFNLKLSYIGKHIIFYSLCHSLESSSC